MKHFYHPSFSVNRQYKFVLTEFLSPYMSYFRRPEVREDMERYTTGLLSDLPRKNGDTIAAVVPNTTEQRLQELLTNSTWDEEAMNYQRIRQMRDKTCVGDGVLIFDDTGFPKQGKHSVGVARQYCGAWGKVANCQVAVTCVYADSAGHWPVNTRLYLHRQWTDAPNRCAKAGVPQEVVFQTKPQIALALLDEARESQIPHRAVVADCGYGGDDTFLSGLEGRPRSAFSPSAGQEASVVAFCSSSSRRRPMGNGYSTANSEEGDAISASLAEITK
ncbi:IS701 family transposase [Dehalococcoidia bacterium]|nr:IS701 family transposase [Dehalococcoidia bacterium]